MVLSSHNRVDALGTNGRPIRSSTAAAIALQRNLNRSALSSSSTTTQSSAASIRSIGTPSSLLSEQEKVRIINDDLLKMIITNDIQNINNNDNNSNNNKSEPEPKPKPKPKTATKTNTFFQQQHNLDDDENPQHYDGHYKHQIIIKNDNDSIDDDNIDDYNIINDDYDDLNNNNDDNNNYDDDHFDNKKIISFINNNLNLNHNNHNNNKSNNNNNHNNEDGILKQTIGNNPNNNANINNANSNKILNQSMMMMRDHHQFDNNLNGKSNNKLGFGNTNYGLNDANGGGGNNGVGGGNGGNGGGGRIHTINKIVGEDNSKKTLPHQLNSEKEMSTMLDSNRVRSITAYFNYSSIVSHVIKDYFEGNIRGKLGSDQLLYDNMLLYLAYLFCARNLILAFVEDIELRAWFGEVERIRPYRQLVMVLTIWSVYMVAILKNFLPNPSKKHPLSWLEVFRVLRGEATPKSFGLNERMLLSWYNYTISMWRFYFIFAMGIFCLFSLQSFGMMKHRWNNYHDPKQNNWYNSMLLFWTIIQIIWGFLTSMHTYICIVYFNSLCYYFRIRYEKVNGDIEIIINKRLKANERVELLHHILVEHNSLCLKVSEYNKFWANHLMSTYFFLVAVVCFTSFQAFFTANLVIIRLYMFLTALLAGFIITRISVSAAIMSNRAHEPYGRLIRVTFEKYPVELQIQLRMFIQRTSGPTIGFYCLDVFEITYTTYASILAALGQNFLLIVDFVRSYAEVGKEYEEISFADLNMLTGSVLNSTLDVLDEMAGTHLSETLHSNNSFISL